MIVNYPTGLFDTVLPKLPGDVGDVTFTCSALRPPRPNLFFLQEPRITRNRTVYITSDLRRRGDLVYTVASSGQTTAAVGGKQYEPGQVLDFVGQPVLELQPQLVVRETVIRHNTNLLDLVALGISQDDIDSLGDKSALAMARLIDDLNRYRSERANTEVKISDNQKLINEVVKAIGAVDAIISVLGDSAAIETRSRLVSKLRDLESDRTVLIELANETAVAAERARNELLTVSQLVR